jgi:hypothetical protein
MRVQLLYFDGCPSWEATEVRLRGALVAVGIVEMVELVEVTSQEHAEQLSFHGSPTVMVDGRDLLTEPDAAFGLMCRVYSTSEGLRGSPTTEQLVDALAGIG